jgi:hypothetical protein
MHYRHGQGLLERTCQEIEAEDAADENVELDKANEMVAGSIDPNSLPAKGTG